MSKPDEKQQGAKQTEKNPQPAHQGHPEKISGQTRNKIKDASTGECVAISCKAHATRFNFCEEHYDHFKFGLVKKTGELVPDYEKKIEHYAAYKSKTKTAAKKAA